MATIQKIQRKSGIRYKITVSCGYDISGKQIRETTTYKPDTTLTPKQQEKALNDFVYQFEQKVLNGQRLQGDKLTFYEFAYKWLNDYAKSALEPSTLQSYVNYLDKQIIPYFGHFKLSDIRPLHLLEFYNHLHQDGIRTDGKGGGYSANTIKKYHAIMSSLFASACKWEMLDTNPCDKVSPPKQSETKRLKHFTLEEIERFLSALDMEYKADYRSHKRQIPDGSTITVNGYQESRRLPLQFKVFFYIALFGGFCREEIIALTWDKIDFCKNTITIDCATGYANKRIYQKGTKTKGSNRLVSMPYNVMLLLKEYRAEWENTREILGDKWQGDNYVFIQWNGKQMYLTTPTKVFADLIKKYNASVGTTEQLPNITLHGLRHPYVKLKLKNIFSVRACLKTALCCKN